MDVTPPVKSPISETERDKQRLGRANVKAGYVYFLIVVMGCGVFVCRRETFLMVATCALVAIGLFVWLRAQQRYKLGMAAHGPARALEEQFIQQILKATRIEATVSPAQDCLLLLKQSRENCTERKPGEHKSDSLTVLIKTLHENQEFEWSEKLAQHQLMLQTGDKGLFKYQNPQ